MNKIFLLLATMALTALLPGSAQAVTNNHSSNTVSYKGGMNTGIPTCGTNQVMTFNGKYICINNVIPAKCPDPDQFIKELKPDGTIICADPALPTGLTCGGTEVISKIVGDTVACVENKLMPPPLCQNDEVITNTPSGLACMQPTHGYSVAMWALTFKHPSCNASTVLGTGSGSESGHNVYSAWCISACHRWCAEQTFGIFHAGTLTAWNGSEAQCACSR